MPDAQIRHVREGYGYAARAARRFQRDLTRHVPQHDRVIVKKAVRKRQHAAVLQREGRVLAVHEAVFRKAHAYRLARRTKAQPVILKPEALFQRHIEARMPAQAEVHCSFVPVLHLVGDLQGAALQRVDHPEDEVPQILRVGFLAARKRQHHARIRLFRKRKFARRRKAVDRQAVRLAVHLIAALPKSCDIWKQRQRPVAPVGGITLPEVLRAVASADRPQLRAQAARRNRQAVVFNRIQHQRMLLITSSMSGTL